MTTPTRILMTGVAVLLASYGLASEEAAPDPPSRPACARLVAAGAEHGPLAESQQAAVAEALRDEYEGEAIYARVLKDLGEIRPFSKVVSAERRHASFLEDLLKSRDLPVPENVWTAAEVPTYASRQEACSAAVEFEARNVALYDRLLATGSLPEDAKLVFEHNRMASLDHHQPAFERCAGRRGGQAGYAAVSGRGGRSCGGQGNGRMARGQGGGGNGCRCGGGRGQGAGQGRGWCRRGGGGPTASAPVEPES